MHFVLIATLFILQVTVRAEDEPLVPTALNKILPRISRGMTSNEVLQVLSSAFPAAKGAKGGWSNVKETGNGSLGFTLDTRYSIEFWAQLDRTSTAVIHCDYPEIDMYLFDHQKKHRLHIGRYYWKNPEKHDTER